MPEYVIISNNPKTYPEYAYNEKIVSTEIYPIYDNRVHTDEQSYAIEYTRIKVKTEYYDVYGMRDRKDSSHYYGMLAGSLPPASPGKLNTYVPQHIGALLSGQSRRDGSLPSKSKTRGINMYRPRRGQRCRPGYKLINGMCVKQ